MAVLHSVFPGYCSFLSAIITVTFCNSSSRVQQSSTVLSLSHCLFSPAILLLSEGACKETSLPSFPSIPFLVCKFPLDAALMMASYYTILFPAILQLSFSVSPCLVYKLCEIWNSPVQCLHNVSHLWLLVIVARLLFVMHIVTLSDLQVPEFPISSHIHKTSGRKHPWLL